MANIIGDTIPGDKPPNRAIPKPTIFPESSATPIKTPLLFIRVCFTRKQILNALAVCGQGRRGEGGCGTIDRDERIEWLVTADTGEGLMRIDGGGNWKIRNKRTKVGTVNRIGRVSCFFAARCVKLMAGLTSALQKGGKRVSTSGERGYFVNSLPAFERFERLLLLHSVSNDKFEY